LLVGRVWQVKEVLQDRKQVLVIPAKEARNVMFTGTGVPEMHPRIAQRVRDLLYRKDLPRYLSAQGQTTLVEARRLAEQFNLVERQIFENEGEWILFPWTGTRAARTLQFLLQQGGVEAEFPNMLFPWVLSISRTPNTQDPRATLQEVLNTNATPTDIVSDIPVELLKTHKFDQFVPETLLRARAASEWIDLDEARAVIARLNRAQDI
jgi:hypothetical protein